MHNKKLPFRRVLGALVLLGLTSLLTTSAVAEPPAPSRGGFHIVRFPDRITDASRSSLERTGARVIDYYPHDSYVVWATPAQLREARDLDVISSVRAVTPEQKLHNTRRLSGSVVAEILAYAESGQAWALFDSLGEIKATWSARADGSITSFLVELPAAALYRVASSPSVLYVGRAPRGLIPEDERTDQIIAGNLEVENTKPALGYRDWLDKMKLDGSGVVVSIIDSGIQENHPDLSGTVVESFNYSPAGEPLDPIGHGTHVAGIVAGNPAAALSDRDGFVYGLGVAPGVQLIDQNAIALTTSFPPEDPSGFEQYTNDAWTAGARMWNASWHTGGGNRVGYLADARAFDELARNAVFEKKGLEEFLLVFSAGNSGRNGPTTPKEAKNMVTVGATGSSRSVATGCVTCILESPEDIDKVASFSSRGPTKDGRIFPTVVAPGSEVVSARAYEEPYLTALGLCLMPPDAPVLYQHCSGTSMAAPHVVGAAALVHQWWKREQKTLPSPAMVKALFVNTATDMAAPDIPNVDEGWGRINLKELFTERGARYVDQKDVFGGPGQKRTYMVNLKRKGPLKITLAWSDAPGGVMKKEDPKPAPALVNDLDLRVERIAGGEVRERWLGNVFLKGQSDRGGKPDRLNNLENVFLLKADPGMYRITVFAENIPGDGLPENSDRTDQDFALVMRWVD